MAANRQQSFKGDILLPGRQEGAQIDLRARSCGLLARGTGVPQEQSGTLFTFIISRVLKCPGRKPDSLGSNPDSAVYKLMTYPNASAL